MDKARAFQVACQAVERLADELGLGATFPFDLIWNYATEEVPSTQRPSQRHGLMREGYIERTGEMINASSLSRAGSLTPQYRLGTRFSPPQQNTHLTADSVMEAIRALETAVETQGLIVSQAELANFYLAMMVSPIVILAGLSGTGKSKLPRVFADLIGARFAQINVQPQWADNSDLFGYTSSLAPTVFIEGKLTRILLNAASSPDQSIIVLLDEMNLAVVEHYFSDFLSTIETRRREGAAVITDSLPLDLPPAPNNEPDPYSHLRGFSFPSNARIVGTANMDETTHLFSPKVIDRAFIIEFDDPDLTVFPTHDRGAVVKSHLTILAESLTNSNNPIAVPEIYRLDPDYFDHLAQKMDEVRQILKSGGVSFGYRTRDAILLYMWYWKQKGLSELLSMDGAFDLCILQKILPKISGTSEALRESLEALNEWLRQERANDTLAESEESEDNTLTLQGPFLRSATKVERMLQRLDAEGATTYWS